MTDEIRSEVASATLATEGSHGAPIAPESPRRSDERHDVSAKSTLTVAAELGQLIGVLLAVIGLVSVVWQLAGLRQATETAAMIGIYTESNEINRFLVSQPRFREHLYADDPNESREARNERLSRVLEELRTASLDDYRALMSVAELEADQFEQVYGLRDMMPESQWNVWWAFFQDTFDSSPLLRAFYDRNRDWYELDDFLRIADRDERRASLLKQRNGR